MNFKFLIVSDSESAMLGGIENHAKILREFLLNHGFYANWLNYKHIKIQLLFNYDIVVFEGIHRMKMLRLLFYKKRKGMILFTHGSFYLNSNKRRYLRKYDSTKHQTSKIVFDKLFMKAILNRFERVITLSNYESRDISDLFKTEPSRLRALEVFSDEFQDHDLSEAITTSFPYQEYICYVGRLDYRKNLMSLIRACLVLNMPLVIAGQDQGMLSALKKYSESESFDKFHYVGKISKEEKLLLLKNSSLVVIPSFFEGVPATAIEARKLRKKVVMTINSYMEDSPCIRKVNPDTDSLINAIKESLDSNTCTDKIISNDEIFTKFIGIVTEIVNLKRG